MKHIILTVEIEVQVPDDVDPNAISFRGIENAVPQVECADVGTVTSYCTQEYIE